MSPGIAVAVSSLGSYPAARTMNALTTLPRRSSGDATAAASATAGCSRHADSTSNGPILYPAAMITSSARPSYQTYPSSSMRAASLVWNHSPSNVSRAASSLFQ